MRFTSQTSSDGVTEQLFTLTFAFGEIPGVLWTPDGAAGTRPLVLMGHGGGQHKKAPGIVARARRFAAECGFAVAAPCCRNSWSQSSMNWSMAEPMNCSNPAS